MEPKLNLMKAILGLEHYFCPKYCGIVDRRRVIGYLLFSVSEVLIILYHFILILRLGEPHGVVADVVNAVLFASLQLAIWTKKLTFTKGLTFLYILAFAKLTANCILSSVFGALPDELSSISNVFLVFLLVLMALTQLMYKTALALIAGLVPMVVFYFIEHPAVSSFFGMKAFFVGFMMIIYVYIYNTNYVLKGLRQPQKVTHVERKALDMLAKLKEKDNDNAGNLMERLDPELRQNIINNASEHLKKEELNNLMWDELCADLTNSEIQICKLVLQDKSLKEICILLDKTESNITSQRSHIRKKLNMDRKDDLKRTLELRFAEIRKKKGNTSL